MFGTANKMGNKGLVGALVAGLAGLGAFFSRAFTSEDRWLGHQPAKRSRYGSRIKPKPMKRPRGGAPSFLHDNGLIARGNKRDFDEDGNQFVELPTHMGFGFARCNATPYGRKSENQFNFAGTKGNHGQTAARRLRRMWARGGSDRSEAVREAKRLGVIL